MVVRKGHCRAEEKPGSSASVQIGIWEGGKIWALSVALQYLWLKVPEIHQERAPSRVLIKLPEGKAVKTGHKIWALWGLKHKQNLKPWSYTRPLYYPAVSLAD